MKPAIEERLNNQIGKARTYNTLFDVVVTASETSLSVTSTHPAENQFDLVTQSFNVSIICNDNDWNTISVSVDVPALDTAARVADIQINAQGGIEEDYHNIPRALRSAIFALVDDICDAIQGFIDELNEEEN